MENPDLQKLFGSMLELTRDVLPKNAFVPAAALMDRAGEITLQAAPFDNQQASEMLSGIIRQQAEAGQLLASGIMLDVMLDDPEGSGAVDAIAFILEHECGEGSLVHQTYKKGMFGKVKLGDLFEESLPDQMRAWTSA